MTTEPETLPTFEEITAPSVHELFGIPHEEAKRSFLNDLFVPPKPETYGRIAPAAAPVKSANGKCRDTASPVQQWLMQLGESNPELCNQILDGGKGLSQEERIRYLRTAYTKHQLQQERTALDEQSTVIKSWRG